MQSDYIKHHGIRGQRWGIRRFQNKDGSLTKAGEKRYYEGTSLKNSKPSTGEKGSREKKGLSDKQKKALKIGATVVGTALAAYGGYKLYQIDKTNKVNKAKVLNNAKSALDEFKSLQSNANKPQAFTVETPKVVRPSIETKTTSQKVESKPTTNYQKFEYNTFKPNTFNYETFSKAASMNDDFVNELLNKNGKMLANF